MARKTRQQLYLELTRAVRENQTANQKLDHAVFKSLGINLTDGRCFDVLDLKGPMSAGDLATAAGLTSGAVTQVIDRLEERGFVARRNDPSDRRRVLVEVTDRGREVASGYYAPLAERAMAEFSHLTRADLELLIDVNDRSTAMQDEIAEEILGRLKG